MILFKFLKINWVFMAKKEVYKLPFFKTAIKAFNFIKVDRNNPNDKESINAQAKNLFKRVKSYLGFTSQTRRIKKMISYATNLKFINTHTESDALLLEDNLIKKHRPIFNIRLIYDKSFPYILISKSNNWSIEYNLLLIIFIDLFLAGLSLKLGGKLAKGPYLPQTLEGLGKTTKAVLGKK